MTTIDPFDLGDAPVGEPLSLVVENSTQWRREINIDEALFTLKYVLRRYVPAEGAIDQSIDMAHVEGYIWGADVLPASMSGWETGRFFWDLVVTRISDDRSRVIDTGEIRVFSNDDDRRSHAEVMVQKIESLIQGRADSDVESYSIKSRSITKMSLSELRDWREYYIREMRSQQPVDAGLFQTERPNSSTLRIRFRD